MLNRPTLFTSEGNGLGTTWGTLNQVQRVYNGYGQIVKEYQQTDGAVTPSSFKVQYIYDQSGNGSRLDRLVYPNGWTEWYNYNPGLDDSIGRVSSVSDGSTSPGQTLESCSYLGLNTIIGRTLAEPGISETTTLDNLNRVADINWTQSGVGLDQFHYDYNADGSVTKRLDGTNPADNQLLTYDAMNRLKSFTVSGNAAGTFTLGTPLSK